MFYREAGQFKTNYKADQAMFPIAQDRMGVGVIIAVGIPIASHRKRLCH